MAAAGSVPTYKLKLAMIWIAAVLMLSFSYNPADAVTDGRYTISNLRASAAPASAAARRPSLPRALLQVITPSSAGGGGNSTTATAAALPGGNTVIIITSPNTPGGSTTSPTGTTSSSNPSSTPVRVLICPGNPECPETATINSTTSTAINTTQGSQNISGTSGPTQSSGTSGVTVSESSGNVTTGPVRPESPRADEPPPQGIDFSKLRGPDTVVATMLLQGISIDAFVSNYSEVIDNITATVSGTPVDVWNITVQQQQQQQQTLKVTWSLYTTNPLIVWYRLTKPTAAAADGNSTNSTSCSTVFCSQLLAAGVPVDGSSIKISPDYNSLVTLPEVTITNVTDTTSSTDMADAGASDALLKTVQDNQARLNTIRRVIGSVASGLIGIGLIWLAWWKREPIMRSLKKCFGCAKPEGEKAKKPSASLTAAAPTAAAGTAGATAAAPKPRRKAGSTAGSSSSSKRSSKKSRDQGRQQRQQRVRSSSDLEAPGSQTDRGADTSSADAPQTPAPTRRYASFEKRKYKAAAEAAVRSPITNVKASGSDASVSSIGSLGSLGSSGVIGSSSSAALRQIRGVDTLRRGSEDDGNISEAGTVITINSFINADSPEMWQQRRQQQQQQRAWSQDLEPIEQ